MMVENQDQFELQEQNNNDTKKLNSKSSESLPFLSSKTTHNSKQLTSSSNTVSYAQNQQHQFQSAISHQQIPNKSTRKCLHKSKKFLCCTVIFLAGALVGYIISYLAPMFINQNPTISSGHFESSSSSSCIPPLTKSKFYEFGVEFALGKSQNLKKFRKNEIWKLRDKENNSEMKYEVYTHTINDYNYAIAGWFKYKNMTPQALADTYFQRKLQEKWDYIGDITTLSPGEPKNLKNLPYNGSRTNPETLYVQSKLPIIQDTDKVLTRGTEMFKDEKTGKILIVSVSRDVGGSTSKIVPFRDDFTRTFSLDVAVVISSTEDPNVSEFFAYIRESTSFTVPEFIIASVVPMTIPEYFSNFYKIAKQLKTPISKKNFFSKQWADNYQDIRKWKPGLIMDPDEKEFEDCNKKETDKTRKPGVKKEETNSIFGAFTDFVKSIKVPIPEKKENGGNQNDSRIELDKINVEHELLFGDN